MYDLLVFIGRFQPLHRGHQEVIEKAQKLSKQVLLLVGSSFAPRTLRNPLTYQERADLIHSIYPDVLTRPLQDHTYNDTGWMTEVRNHVKDVLLPKGGKWQPNGLADFKVGLIGCDKDHTTYYLKMFPDWENENVAFVNPLNSTVIREQLYSDHLPARFAEAAIMEPSIYDWLVKFKNSEDFKPLKYMYDYIYDPVTGCRAKFGKGVKLTADTLVQCGSKILIIRRGREYGHGLLAMPGGFVEVDENETFLNAAMRELREEVRLKVPETVLRGSIVNRQVFDNPHRSERDRLITECFHVRLKNEQELPKFKGSIDPDEVDEIFWMDVSDLRREDFFEDHFHIITYMLNSAPKE